MIPRKSHPFTHTASRARSWLRTPSIVLPIVLLSSLPWLASCGPSEAEREQAKEEIRVTLMNYLPKMAEAYRTGEVDALEGLTTQKERSILRKNIDDLASQGRSVDTELIELTIEDLNLVTYASAYVTTAEYWKVKSYAVGTDQVLGEDPRQFSRVRYQLERKQGRWIILARNRDPSLNP